MGNGVDTSRGDTNSLLKAISEKLEANRAEIAKSMAYGHLTWRVKNGHIELSLDLRL